MPGEDGDHAPVQGDGDEKAAAQLLEDARGTLRWGPELTDRILCGWFVFGGDDVKEPCNKTPLCARWLGIYWQIIEHRWVWMSLRLVSMDCSYKRPLFLFVGWASLGPSRLCGNQRSVERMTSGHQCSTAAWQRLCKDFPHVKLKTAPGQKLRNSSIFDRYPHEWPVSSAWKVFVVRCWADSGRMFHFYPFSSIFLCMSMRPKKSSRGLHTRLCHC